MKRRSQTNRKPSSQSGVWAERSRLQDAKSRKAHWYRWGPYLSERQWGTVREDYSESLRIFHRFHGDGFKVECPTGSGDWKTLNEVAGNLAARLVSIFERGEDGLRPSDGANEKARTDPHWRDCILFNEYFHGDTGAGLGANHQTGWTALAALLMQPAPGRARN